MAISYSRDSTCTLAPVILSLEKLQFICTFHSFVSWITTVLVTKFWIGCDLQTVVGSFTITFLRNLLPPKTVIQIVDWYPIYRSYFLSERLSLHQSYFFQSSSNLALPLQIYMKVVACCFCSTTRPHTNIYSCGGYWYIPLAYLLATISNNIRDYKYTFIVIFSSISISISNNIRDYKHIHLL